MRTQTIIWILLFLAFSCNYAEKELYRIPADYQGNIVIVSNIENGERKVYDEESNSRLYAIPSSGILVTQFEKGYGIINKTFNYISGSANEIPSAHYQENKENLDSTKVFAFYGNGFNIENTSDGKKFGIEVITICKPQEYSFYSNDPFIKWLFNGNIAANEMTYANLVKERKSKPLE